MKQSKIIIPIAILGAALILGICIIIGMRSNKKEEELSPKELLNSVQEEEKKEPIIDNVLPPETKLDEETLKEMFREASELVTLKYYYTNAADTEKYRKLFNTDAKMPFSTEKYVFTYDGVINAGIDVSKIVYEKIDNDSKIINVTIPYPKIISHEIKTDSFMWYDVKKSVFTEINPEDVTSQMDELKKRQEYKLQNDSEFYPQIIKNTENVLKNLLITSELTKEYTISFKVSEQTDIITENEMKEAEDAYADYSGSKNMIRVNKDAKKYIKMNYKDVKIALEDSGFTNIELEPLGDMSTGFLVDEGEVKTISINGNEDFKSGDFFPSDAIIRIKYHSYNK